MASALRDARRHHQYRVSIDKTANGIVAMTRLWADEQISSPLCMWR